MKPLKPRTGIQDAVYMTYANDVGDRNLNGLLRASIRRLYESLPDHRSPEDRVRFRRLVIRKLHAKRWLAKKKLTAMRPPSRKLMLVGARK